MNAARGDGEAELNHGQFYMSGSTFVGVDKKDICYGHNSMFVDAAMIQYRSNIHDIERSV